MIKDNIRNYDQLAEEFRDEGDLATIRMVALRNAHGADRLGSNVIVNIQERLSAMGIGHQPETLPNSQYAIVLLYRKGTSLDKLIRHLRDIKEDSSDQIRQLIGDDEVKDKLRRIKEVITG